MFGQPAVDFLDHVHGKDLAIRLARELVGAVRGPHRDRQRVDLGGANEIDRLVRVSQQLIVADFAFDAVAVLLLAAAMFERAEHTELALHRRADPVRHVDDAPGNIDIVVVIRRGLGVGLQRTVHHHRSEAVLKRGGAGGFLIAMILMQAQRDLRIHLLQRVDHLRQHDVVGVAARAARRLDDHRRVDRGRGVHDRQPLLHVVDVECRHAVAVLGGMIEQLPQGNSRHRILRSIVCIVQASQPRAGIPDRAMQRVPPSDGLRGNAEFAIEHLRRRRCAEAGHPDEFAAIAEPARPVALDRGLDTNARRAAQHFCPVFLRLPAEQLEAGGRDDRSLDAVLGE